MIIEQLRTDSLMVGVFRISQLVGLACFVVGTACLIVFLNRAKAERESETVEYSSVYAKLRKTKPEEASEKTEKELEEEAREDEILSRLIKKEEKNTEIVDDDE